MTMNMVVISSNLGSKIIENQEQQNNIALSFLLIVFVQHCIGNGALVHKEV